MWLVGTVTSIFLLQVAVTMARPVSTYRLLALGADGTTLGLTAACFAVPPMLLAVGFGRWTERHHPAILLALGLGVSAVAGFGLVVAEAIPALALATTTLGIGQAFILVAAGGASQVWGVEVAFALLAVVMFATAGAGIASARRGPHSAGS